MSDAQFLVSVESKARLLWVVGESHYAFARARCLPDEGRDAKPDNGADKIPHREVYS